MKWMEFIKVQVAKSDIDAKLEDLIADHKSCQGLLKARVFRHALVGDCSILLTWNTDNPEVQGSTMGQYIKNALKQYGLVDHSVWIERGAKEEITT